MAIAAGCCLLFAEWPCVRATIYGQISGVIKDSSGAVIPAAAVTVTNTETGVTRSANSDADGSYHFPALLYSIEPAEMWKNLDVPLHPGAERYFREKKLMQ
jgi:hypothetical protein